MAGMTATLGSMTAVMEAMTAVIRPMTAGMEAMTAVMRPMTAGIEPMTATIGRMTAVMEPMTATIERMTAVMGAMTAAMQAMIALIRGLPAVLGPMVAPLAPTTPPFRLRRPPLPAAAVPFGHEDAGVRRTPPLAGAFLARKATMDRVLDVVDAGIPGASLPSLSKDERLRPVHDAA
jgi:hypothetical protein